MGKGGGKVKLPGPGPLETEQAEFLKGQRRDVIEPIQAALLPAALPGAIQAFRTKLDAPEREALEGQYAQAGRDIMSGVGGRGGQLRNLMSLNAMDRARSISNAAINARQTGIQRSLGLLGPAAFPGAQSVLSAGQGLVGSERDRANMAAQAASQQAAGKGNALGGLMSLGGGLMKK